MQNTKTYNTKYNTSKADCINFIT